MNGVRVTVGGDAQAAGDRFWGLYEASLPHVYGFLARPCGKDTAEDLTQEVYVDLARRARRGDDLTGLRIGWLISVARSRLIDHLRELTSEPLGPSIERLSQPVLPTGLVVSSAGVLVDVDNDAESLRILDPETLGERGALAVEPDHGDMTVAPDGSVWLVRGDSHAVVHITPRPI